ncbi:DUF2007 domain-containing protein [Aliikangiella sp. G2MR2-5]|uniref:putative signal transducing protein n=1 Tax=Aliikangiella sp. G2MR2-5 TaxID=2788943 RepID=UPI0018AB2144|nr:DUF2007 domain-containing protein [Aliikangiella sp. G2MR2-5]
MELLYRNENRLVVYNIKNLLESKGIPSELRNEFASNGAVEAPQIFVELWVDKNQIESCREILESIESKNLKDWICSQCGERNGGAFELCWNCQNENG